ADGGRDLRPQGVRGQHGSGVGSPAPQRQRPRAPQRSPSSRDHGGVGGDTVTQDEWEAISYLLENAWRGEVDDDRPTAYFGFLRHLDVEAVRAALHRLAEDARPFVPTAPEILAAVRDN